MVNQTIDCFSLSCHRHVLKPNIPPGEKNEDKRTNYFLYTKGDHFRQKHLTYVLPEICEEDISNVLHVKRVTRKQALEAERNYYHIRDDSGSDSGNDDNVNKCASDTDDEARQEKFK